MLNQDDAIHNAVKNVAEKMLLAARTAPKGRGENNIKAICVVGDEIKKISDALKTLGEKEGIASFVRDAENILSSDSMILIGTAIKPLGLKKCGMCGFENCAAKSEHPDVPCVFNTGDLGIAIGSAVSIAMDARVDNRIMYTVGQAVREMGLLGEEIKIIYAIPLSGTSKNPFFDRA